MPKLFIDFENFMTSEIRLSKMTLRQYLARAPILGCGWAEDDEAVRFMHADDTDWPEFTQYLCDSALNNDYTFVAHQASYDVRCARFGHTTTYGMMNVPQPQHVHCTLELAYGAFPNQPGGYSLKKLARSLKLSAEKIEVDLTKQLSRDDLAEYCIRDVELCRDVYRLCLPKLHPNEVKLAELANRVRECHFDVRTDRVKAAMAAFSATAAAAVTKALSYMDSDGGTISDNSLNVFGWHRRPGTLGPDDPGVPQSVKAAKIKDLLLDRLGFDTRTITYKKINPEHLRQNIPAANLLKSTSELNKALSHKRRVHVFDTAAVVDIESSFFAAHTGRYSAKSTGKGLNTHSLPKHNPAVAKPFRQMFELPKGLCFVRGDFSGVEYRHEGFLTHCAHTKKLFTDNLFADPYASFGKEGTGMIVTKEDPARQVFKMGVLQLGFMAGVGNWMGVLALMLSDPVNEVSLQDLDNICIRQGWGPVNDQWVKGCQTKLGCAWQIATVAYQTRNAFHRVHPEFQRFGKWLMYTLTHTASALDPEYELAECYKLDAAPDPNRVLLSIDYSLYGRSIRVRCGSWPSVTIAWRDIGMRDTAFGFCLASVQAGDKGYRKLTPSIVVENVVQSSARNALCAAKLELDRRGWHYLLSVHDEILIICDQNPATVLKARQDLLEVTGPGNKLGWEWATVINPAEVNVSKSLYEQPMETLLPPIGEKTVKGKVKPIYGSPAAWWMKLGEPDGAKLLDNLP